MKEVKLFRWLQRFPVSFDPYGDNEENLWYSVKNVCNYKPEKTRHDGSNTVETGKTDTDVGR